MASYIDWYLVELDRRLRGRMPDEPLFILSVEVEDHLRTKCEDLISNGMTAPQAERAAVQSFGTGEEVALAALYGVEKPGTNLKASRNFTIGLVGVWIAALSVAITGFVPGNTIAAAAIFCLAIAFFFVGSTQSHRIHWRKIAVLSSGGALALICLLPNGFRPISNRMESKFWIAEDARDSDYLAKDWQASISFLNRGLSFFKALDAAHGDVSKMKQTAPRTSNGHISSIPDRLYFPGQLGLISSDPRMQGQRWDTGQSISLSEAKKSWLKNGPVLVKQAIIAESQAKQRIKDDQYTLTHVVWLSRPFVIYGIFASVCLASGLILFNFAIYLATSLMRRIRIRRPLVA